MIFSCITQQPSTNILQIKRFFLSIIIELVSDNTRKNGLITIILA